MHSHCLGLLKFSYLLNMIHEVTSIHILHDKVQAILADNMKPTSRSSSRPATQEWSIQKIGVRVLSASAQLGHSHTNYQILKAIVYWSN